MRITNTIFCTFLFSIFASALAIEPAMAFQQQAQVKVLPTSGKGVARGKSNVLLEAYLSTRDPNSTRGNMKTNPVGTVGMVFPPGSMVNKAAVGAGNVCQQSEYTPPSSLSIACSKAVIGRGWALLNGGAPVLQDQIPGAPASCGVSDASQYSRTWHVSPASGPSCVPVGSIYVKITAYQGGLLSSKYWCYGLDWYSKANAASLNGKSCSFKDAKSQRPNIDIRGISGKPTDTRDNPKFNPSLPEGPDNLAKLPVQGADIKGNPTYRAANNGCNIIFANENGVAPLSFGGAVGGCGSVLSVVIPALNPGGGLGELTGGIVLSDFYLKISNGKYLKSGPCVRRKFDVNSTFTYSRLKGEDVLPAGVPSKLTVKSSGACTV